MTSVKKQLALTLEMTGTDWSEGAIAIALKELANHHQSAVISSLERCSRECKFKITLADIIERLRDYAQIRAGRGGMGNLKWPQYMAYLQLTGRLSPNLPPYPEHELNRQLSSIPLYEKKRLGIRPS